MKLCISTVVDKKYEAWMPIFICCCKTQYPEYDIKIFCADELSENVAHALKLIVEKKYDGIDIVSDCFRDWHRYEYSPISWRFLINKEEYRGFDYIYITDIDMMILREKVELLYYHLNEMERTGLCYSNSIRNRKHWKGNQSVTGLHFASYEFFERTEEAMEKYSEKVKTGEVGAKREYDGNMLYRIIKESKLGICGKYPLAERHHGIHMGSFRLYKGNLKRKLNKRVDKDKCRKWLTMLKDETFREIIKLCSVDPVIKEQTDALQEFCEKRVG